MSRSSTNFNNEKIKKSDFYKNKKIFNIDNIDVNKMLVSKKETYGKYNSLLGIMTMMLLDHYIYFFHK